MDYPDGTRFNKWILSLENQRGAARWTIKRWVYPIGSKPRLERLPVAKYRLWRDDESELRKLVIRLNEKDRPTRAKEVIEIRHAFISTAFLEKYRAYLIAQIPSKRQALTEYNCLMKYALGFFIGRLHLADPLAWHLASDTEWANYLMSEEVPKSRRTLQNIIEGLNRFMAYLHKHRPAEVPPLKFKPFTRAKFKEIEAARRLNGDVRERTNIKDEHWALIRVKLKELAPDIEPFVMLSYHYGLRRAETLGLFAGNVKVGYLSVERQLVKLERGNKREQAAPVPAYGPPKSRKARKVPHWCASPAAAVAWIQAGADNLMHPDTLSDTWLRLMAKLGLSYDFHDIRHTWITKALRLPGVIPRDVQLAAGHVNIETTMQYAHDDRKLDDRPFIPDARKSG